MTMYLFMDMDIYREAMTHVPYTTSIAPGRLRHVRKHPTTHGQLPPLSLPPALPPRDLFRHSPRGQGVNRTPLPTNGLEMNNGWPFYITPDTSFVLSNTDS